MGHTDGIMAILPYSEIRVEIRSNPKATCKILELIARQAYETTHYNVKGESSNPTIKLHPTPNN